MNQAFEKMKMLVGMEVEDEQRAAEEESSLSFMEDLNRNCALSTKQVLFDQVLCICVASFEFGFIATDLVSYTNCVFVQLEKLGS